MVKSKVLTLTWNQVQVAPKRAPKVEITPLSQEEIDALMWDNLGDGGRRKKRLFGE